MKGGAERPARARFLFCVPLLPPLAGAPPSADLLRTHAPTHTQTLKPQFTGHKIKTPKTQLAQRALPCAVRLVISGTPIQNDLGELLDVCAEGLLGDFRHFKTDFERPITAGRGRAATTRARETGAAVAAKLRRRIAPVFLRRLKRAVFTAPAPRLGHRPAYSSPAVWLSFKHALGGSAGAGGGGRARGSRPAGAAATAAGGLPRRSSSRRTWRRPYGAFSGRSRAAGLGASAGARPSTWARSSRRPAASC